MNKKIKQSIYVIALASFATVAVFFTSCDNNNNKYSSERAEDAAEDLRDAKKDLDEAQREYTIKYNDFKREMDNKITENDKAIAALKADVRERNAEAKVNWNTAVNDLERKTKIAEQLARKSEKAEQEEKIQKGIKQNLFTIDEDTKYINYNIKNKQKYIVTKPD